jgi:antitoxin component YwqK of YwqJK toxin-antitoxin module
LYRGWYESGALKFESPHVEDKKHGETTHYYENGVKKSVITYEFDKEQGLGEWRNENDSVKTREYYKDGKLHGICFYYSYFAHFKKVMKKEYENGTMIKEEQEVKSF